MLNISVIVGAQMQPRPKPLANDATENGNAPISAVMRVSIRADTALAAKPTAMMRRASTCMIRRPIMYSAARVPSARGVSITPADITG